ncbi:MAG: hypothetical protein AB7S65_08805 [Sulfuricurvum sp.]
MLLFGHPYIPSQTFYHIESFEAIRKSPANSVLTLFFSAENLDLIAHLRKNNIRFGLHIQTLSEAVLGENLGASYLIVDPRDAAEIQAVAEHYLFNAKVLGYVDSMDHLEMLIEMRLDGAIFAEAIVKITS